MSLKKIIVSVASVLLMPWYVMGMEDVAQSNTNNQLSNYTMNTVSYIIQGGKSIQEDYVYIPYKQNKPILTAVFDGNGGIGQDAIEKDLLKRLNFYSNVYISIDYAGADLEKAITSLIKNIFYETNSDFEEINKVNKDGYQHYPWQSAGSTAVVLFFISQYNKFFIAWCGDSEVIWSENGELKSTMPAHHLQERAGPYSFYRSFGNFAANNPNQSKFVEQSGYQMTAEPDVIAIDANNTEWMLMATDGLWATTSKKEVFDLVKNLLEKRKEYLLYLKPILDNDLDLYEKKRLIKKRYSDREIVRRVMLLSILNDVKHNFVEKWFQFFFKEYIRIIFPSLRQKNVAKNSYISNLKYKVIELIRFMQAVQFVLDDFPFIISSQNLQVRNYMQVAWGIDKAVFKAELEAGQSRVAKFVLLENIEECDFPVTYNVNAKVTKKELNSMDAIIRYLYCNLDDGTLADRLKEVFNLNFETAVSEQDNNAFCYQQRCFWKIYKKIF